MYGQRSVNVQSNRIARQQRGRHFAEVREKVRRLLKAGLIDRDDLADIDIATVDELAEREEYERTRDA